MSQGSVSQGSGSQGSGSRVEVSVEDIDFPTESVEALARAALRAIDFEEAELSIVLCSDAHIQALNRDWRGKDAPTDVLSFPQQEGEGLLEDDEVLGDLVISIDTARRQAGELGHDLDQELAVLLVHGLLHLLGYDHEDDEQEAEEMRGAEGRLLAKLGRSHAGLIDRSAS